MDCRGRSRSWWRRAPSPGGRSRPNSPAKTAAEVREETGCVVEHRAADLTRAGDVDDLIFFAAERFGGVDVLVNNTGGPPAGTFEDGDWQAAFELILLSLIRCVRGVLPSMRERGGGRIVDVASSSVKQPIENLIRLENVPRRACWARQKPRHRARP